MPAPSTSTSSSAYTTSSAAAAGESADPPAPRGPGPKGSGPGALDALLCFDVYATSRLITKAYRTLLDRLELTYPQYLVMTLLWSQDRQTVKALGDALELDSGTLSPLLKRLETAGFVRRERARRDEREVEITLTSSGRELQAAAQGVPEEMACMMCLPSEEATQLQHSLRQLRASLERVMGGE